jgi:hypothetical protein
MKLRLPQSSIDTVTAKQRFVRPPFDGDAGLEDHNLISMHHRGKPVRDDQGGAAPRNLTQIAQDLPLGLGVKR